MDKNSPSLETHVASIRMKNPVMTASGTFGYGNEYADFIDLNQLGATVVKGITNVPWPGNPMQRIAETPSGMLNAIGLQNVGVDNFIEKKLPYLRNFEIPVIVNICGERLEEYEEITEKLDATDGVAAIELNISCPNLHCGGMSFWSRFQVDSSACQRGARKNRIAAAGEAFTERHRHNCHCFCRSGCRRRRTFSNQHVTGYGN